MSPVSTYTSDWRSRTKAQLLDDVHALIEMRDRETARADRAEAERDMFRRGWRLMRERLLAVNPKAVARDLPEDAECCASGRCEVCSPGYVWGNP